MSHWLNHIWNDPLSAKEQLEVGFVFFLVMLPVFFVYIGIQARKRDL